MKIYHEHPQDQHSHLYSTGEVFQDVEDLGISSSIMGSKQWIVVPIPSAYSATNYPIRVYYAILLFSIVKVASVNNIDN